MMTRKLLTAVVLSSTVLASGCARDEMSAAPAEAAATAAPAATEAGDATLAQTTATSASDAVPTTRKLIQTAELDIEVESYAIARRALDKQLKDLGGYVANAEVEHHDGEISSAVLTLRVPAEKLGELVSDAAGYGTVVQEKLDTQDISDAYYDMSARLRNAKRLEARLLELVAADTDGVKSLLEVERELARVREQVERYEGQLKRFDQQVAMSTVKLRLSTRRIYVAAAKPTFRERIADTFSGSLRALGIAGYALVLFVVALVPWLLPFVLALFGLRALMRRHRARRQAEIRQAHARASAPMGYGPLAGSESGAGS
jgi:hypothetical protein